MKSIFCVNKKILFLGIGGIGVSGLAIAAKKFGAQVDGYDDASNKLIIKLKSLGIFISSNFNDICIKDYDIIVYSTAMSNNLLLLKAKSLGIQCLQRAVFLDMLMKNFNYSIAITGTHGKTTTSGILATLLYHLDKYSSYIIGGILKYFYSNIEINGNDKLVVEADESDASFLFLNPKIILITNIDLDHMATYDNSYEKLIKNFAYFINKKSVSDVYLCYDDNGCRYLLSKYIFLNKKIISYGFSKNADIQIYDYCIKSKITYFKIFYKGIYLNFKIKMPGKHNVLNAAVCIILCLNLGFKYKDINKALLEFKGVLRRFNIYKKVILGYKTYIIDDYGHHPTEIFNTLSAIKDLYPNKKIIHIFQPHRYTRNRDLIKEWKHSFILADYLILLPTYSAGEKIILGAETKDIINGISNYIYAKNFNEAIHYIKKIIHNKLVILIQGAGNISDLVNMLT